MPELPEVEHIRRSLVPLLIGAKVTRAQLRRRDVVHGSGGAQPRGLLHRATIREIARHGKDLAIVADSGRTLGVHLGMSGWLSWVPRNGNTQHDEERPLDHVHCLWTIRGPAGQGELRFRDPRRFGGLWTYRSIDDWKNERLHSRGPDALAVTAKQLIKSLADSRRPIKAALLDQSVLAGVGNIYADESLFAVGVHPKRSAHRFARDEQLVRHYCSSLKRILRRAIDAGGSTIRSYQGVNGDPGTFIRWHKVYGRAGEPCVKCNAPLRATTVAQRTTVFCPHCQSARPNAEQRRRAVV